MAAKKKPQGIVDDIIKIGAKATKATIQGVRSNKKYVKETLKKEIGSAASYNRKQIALKADKIYRADPNKYATGAGYLAEAAKSVKPVTARQVKDAKRAALRQSTSRPGNNVKSALRAAAANKAKTTKHMASGKKTSKGK